MTQQQSKHTLNLPVLHVSPLAMNLQSFTNLSGIERKRARTVRELGEELDIDPDDLDHLLQRFETTLKGLTLK